MVQEVLLGIMGFIGLWQSLLYALPEVVLTGARDRKARETCLIIQPHHVVQMSCGGHV